ncbi:MAG: hypothetical protein M3Q69_20870 [Acidobacteriota bacterium]|nr:hypothetical protein [Acidobacteriota bacterium]
MSATAFQTRTAFGTGSPETVGQAPGYNIIQELGGLTSAGSAAAETTPAPTSLSVSIVLTKNGVGDYSLEATPRLLPVDRGIYLITFTLTSNDPSLQVWFAGPGITFYGESVPSLRIPPPDAPFNVTAESVHAMHMHLLWANLTAAHQRSYFYTIRICVQDGTEMYYVDVDPTIENQPPLLP